MRITKLIALGALLALTASTAIAGEQECSYGTQECLDYMATKMKDSGWVGVELSHAEGDSGPMKITKVVADSPAQEAGIEVGDILYGINGLDLANASQEELMMAASSRKAGDSATWTMKRDGADRKVKLTLAPMPANVLAAYIGQHMIAHATIEVAANTP